MGRRPAQLAEPMAPQAPAEAGEKPSHRAGRNLPAAIGIGVALAAAVLVTLFTVRWAFVALAIVAMVVAVHEVSSALRRHQVRVPEVPVVLGAAAMLVAAYLKGVDSLVIAVLLTGIAVVVWRLGEPGGAYLRDVGAGLFVAVYIPFLAAFAVLMAVPDDGARRVVTYIATVVCSDVGGYAVGVLFGRHPMAPTVSPKKSWEGFAGSVVACAACAGLLVPLYLHGLWWQGVLLGLAIVVVATLGDLGESMIKRDLGIKDMGRLLPGHGGLMDRLDSLLPAAPVAWALLAVFVHYPN